MMARSAALPRYSSVTRRAASTELLDGVGLGGEMC
jgi:hypothetical protein